MFSDSRYVVDNYTRAMKIWPNRAWKGSNGMPVENIDSWKKLRRLVNKLPVRVDIEWVKAHKSNVHTKRGCISIEGQSIKIRIISREYVKKANTYEYRYEVIDSNDKAFKDLDFIFCDEILSRNKCLHVRFNAEQSRPFIVEVIEELDCSEYKY